LRTTVASADIGDIIFSFFSSFRRACLRLLGEHLSGASSLLELGELVLELVALAELLLDRLHLLVEVVLLLVFSICFLTRVRIFFSTWRISISACISS
jgi:hypothetical protein